MNNSDLFWKALAFFTKLFIYVMVLFSVQEYMRLMGNVNEMESTFVSISAVISSMFLIEFAVYLFNKNNKKRR